MHIFNYSTNCTLFRATVFLWVIYVTVVFDANAQKERIKAKQTSFGMGYLEYLPADYNSSNAEYPVIIYLHGTGEKGNGTTELNYVKRWGPLRKINEGNEMCFTVNGKKECFIVIGPQTNSYWDEGTVDNLLDYVTSNYRVNPNKVYLTGLSLGGIGTWNYSYSEQNRPNRLAAIAPVSGSGDPAEVCYLAKNDIAVWAFHGAKDNIISSAKSQKLIDALNECEFTTDTPVKFSLYNGIAHNGEMWETAYDDTHEFQNPNLYEWFLEQERNSDVGSSPAAPAPAPAPTPNQEPVAKAGPDQSVDVAEGQFELNGEKSADADGQIKSYKWSQKSGPSCDIRSSTAVTTRVTDLNIGTYVFVLKVTDNKGATDTDQVKVVVTKQRTLIADAGNDQSTTLPNNGTVLDGSKSSVSEGEIVDYAWEKLSGSINFGGIQHGKTYRVENMRPGEYIFELTITDDMGATSTDRVNIFVNKPPVADAGSNKAITLPTRSITLDAGNSYDEDGSIKSYTWEKLSGSIDFGGFQNGKTITIEDMRPGEYVFELTVTDDNGAASSDQVKIFVNKPPVADAGSDMVITLPNRTITLDARNSYDEDGNIKKYAWKKLSGSIDFGGIQHGETYTVDNMRPGDYEFQLTVTDNKGGKSTDRVKVTINESNTARIASKPNAKVTKEEQQNSTEASGLAISNTKLNAYPNPVSSQLNLEITPEIKGHAKISILNLNGKILSVREENIADGQMEIKLDLSSVSIPTGVFFVKIESDKYPAKVLKLIKY